MERHPVDESVQPIGLQHDVQVRPGLCRMNVTTPSHSPLSRGTASAAHSLAAVYQAILW